MDVSNMIYDLFEVIDYFPGGTPAIVFSIAAFVFFGLAIHRFYRQYFPKIRTPKKPESPPASPPTDEAGGEGGAEPVPPDAAEGEEEGEKKEGFFSRFRRRMKIKRRRVSLNHLRQSFRHHLDALGEHSGERDFLYQTPWFMVIGEAGSGKSTLLDHLGLEQPLPPPAYRDPDHPRGCDWWFYNNGIVLDASGDMVLYLDEAAPEQPLADERGWKTLLQLLLRHRTRRPLDGMVVTIPATDLAAEAGVESETLKRKAETLFQRLFEAQKTLGMRMPVYILITQSDHIPGFQSFAHLLPARMRAHIFGWSNPYAPETVYNNSLLDQAFQKIYRDLNELQLELITAHEEPVDNDAFLLFPHELRPVFRNLRLYLEHIFKTGVYHEPFIFRGIYFTGDAGPGADISPGAGAPFHPSDSLGFNPGTEGNIEIPRYPVFLTDLFEQKIFPEANLARPVYRIFKTRNKLLWATQASIAGVVILGAGSQWWATRELQRELESLRPVLDNIAENAREQRELRLSIRLDKSYFAESNRLQRDSAVDLLNDLAELKSDGLATPLMPTSLFSEVDSRITESLSWAYSRFVLRWLYNGLHRQSRKIIYKSTIQEQPEIGAEAIENLPEFISLSRYVKELEKLQEYARIYNNLDQEQDKAKQRNNHMGNLVVYLYNVDLPLEFYRHTGYYGRALRRAKYEPFDLSFYQDAARTSLHQLSEELFQRIIDRNPLLLATSRLEDQLAALERTSRHEEWFEILNELSETIDTVRAYLKNPAYQWTIQPNFDLGEAFSQTLRGIENIELFGEEIKNDLRETAKSRFEELREALLARSSDLTENLLMTRAEVRRQLGRKPPAKMDSEVARQRELELMLSPAVLRLKQILGDFLERDFMAEVLVPREIRDDLPGNKQLIWDVAKLREVVDLAQNFQSFLDNELPRFPESLQDIAVRAGHFQLHANMRQRVAEAQEFQTRDRATGAAFEKNLRGEVENFGEAAPVLGWILDLFALFKEAENYPEKFATTHEELQKLGVIQAHRMLSSVNRLLEQDDLYAPREADYFEILRDDPTQTLSMVVYDVQDREELKYYLEVQRDRIYFLAQTYAQPLLDFLGERPVPPGFANSPVIPRWTRIYNELYQYDSEQPENSLSILENYILFELDKITLENCYSQLYENDFGNNTGDFFLQKRQELQKLLFQRCRAEQRFIADDETQAEDLRKLQTDLPLSKALFWDVMQLQDTVVLAESFGRFVEKELPNLPAEEQKSARDAGFSDFHARLMDSVARAQIFDAHLWQRGASYEKGLRDEIQNFAEAVPLLEWLLDFMGQLESYPNQEHQDKFGNSQQELEQLAVTQAHHLLTHGERLLAEDNLYKPLNPDFFKARNQADKPLSLLAFEVESQEALRHYVDSQRERIHFLALNFVQPPLNFIGGRPVPPGLSATGVVPRWTNIYQELQKYDHGNPENTVKTLEDFILFGMDSINLGNCYSQLYQRDLGNRQQDYFLAKRAALQDKLYRRCHLVYPMAADSSALGGEASAPELQPTLPLGQHLAWDSAKLREAVELANAFSQFLEQDMPELPPSQQQTVREQGYLQFHHNVVALLVEAQTIEEQMANLRGVMLERALAGEVENFSEAAPMIDWLLEFFHLMSSADTPHQDRFAETRASLRNLAMTQAYRLLGQLDRLLREDDLYKPLDPEFPLSWDGAKSLTRMAFGSEDEEALQHYLDVQRNRVHYLAGEYAQPLLRFIGVKPAPPQYGHSGAVPRWARIYNELFKYDTEKPDNSVSKLESFILKRLNQLTLGNCYEQLYWGNIGKAEGDYFLEKRAQLRNRLFQQCQYLADLEAYRRYHIIQDFFNQKLAGRFPFAARPEGKLYSEAAPQDVRDFYYIYQTYGENLREFLGMSRTFGASRNQAIRFLDQIEQMFAFLAPMLQPTQEGEDNPPVFDFLVDFRVNQTREIGANQIIDWRLEKTNQGVNFFTQDQPATPLKPQITGEREGSWHFSDRWNVGDAFRFSLRWARNSVYRPYWDGEKRNFYIAGNNDTAVFEFRGQWALLKMIMDQAATIEDFDRLEDAEPHTLKFEVPVRRLLPARRLPPQPVEEEKPRIDEDMPRECYMDWYEDAYGDERCLKPGYEAIPGKDSVHTPPESRRLAEEELGQLSPEDAPYPSRQSLNGARLGEQPVDLYQPRYSEEFVDKSRARLYLRITLSHPERKEVVAMPDFPQAAPGLKGLPPTVSAYRKQNEVFKTLSSPLPPPPDAPPPLPEEQAKQAAESVQGQMEAAQQAMQEFQQTRQPPEAQPPAEAGQPTRANPETPPTETETAAEQ